MDSKACKLCGQSKPVDLFRMAGGKPHAWCLSCYKQYCRDRYAARKAVFSKADLGIATIQCIECGEHKSGCEFYYDPSVSALSSKKCKSCTGKYFSNKRKENKIANLSTEEAAACKTCCICKQSKPKHNFFKSNSVKSGVVSRCKECWKITNKYDRSTSIKYNYASRKASPEKHKAREMLSTAIRSGRVERMPCVVCGMIYSEGHHDDYSKPFDVVWLCRKHHFERHMEIKREKVLSEK